MRFATVLRTAILTLVLEGMAFSQQQYQPNSHTLFYVPFDSTYSQSGSTYFPELGDTPATPDPHDCQVVQTGNSGIGFTPLQYDSSGNPSPLFPLTPSSILTQNDKIDDATKQPDQSIVQVRQFQSTISGGGIQLASSTPSCNLHWGC